MVRGEERVRCMERVTWKLTSPYIKETANGNLLYGSGNSNRDSVSTQRGGTEKAMAPHASTLAWKIPWTEEPGRLQTMGSLRVRNDWVTSLSLLTFMHWRRKWQPTPVFLPGESQDRGAWWAAFYRVAQSRTRLKWLSISSSSSNCQGSLTEWFKKFNCWDFFFFFLVTGSDTILNNSWSWFCY